MGLIENLHYMRSANEIAQLIFKMYPYFPCKHVFACSPRYWDEILVNSISYFYFGVKRLFANNIGLFRRLALPLLSNFLDFISQQNLIQAKSQIFAVDFESSHDFDFTIGS